MAVDETSGDLMIIYYETGTGASRVEANIWMQSSTDDGVTWSSATKITTSSTDEVAASAQADFQYGDYIGLTGYAGQFFACWTDRRSGGVEEIWGAGIPLVERAITFELDRDHYGQDEIDALRNQPGGARSKRRSTSWSTVSPRKSLASPAPARRPLVRRSRSRPQPV